MSGGGSGSSASPVSNGTTPVPIATEGGGSDGVPVQVSSSVKSLEMEVSGLDAELDELQRLQEMTADAETHESHDAAMVGGGGAAAGRGLGGASDGANSAGGAREGAAGGSLGRAGGYNSDTAEEEVDRRSVYVGNVDYSATPQEVQEHFKSCGNINRITIMVDKITGHPKGFAYIEFDDVDAVQHAILLSDTVFRSRQIKVIPKRKNIPGFLRGRGRGYSVRGGGMYRASFRGRGGYRPYYRPRGGYARGYGRPY